MMGRRDFLRSAAGFAAALTLGPQRLLAAASADPTATAFADALGANPWLLGYADASQDRYEAAAEPLAGSLPPELRGVLYRNGPARHQVGGRRYHHWFDGDGLIQAFRFGDGGVDHSARFVETEKWKRERASGAPAANGFGTAWPDAPPTRGPEDGNAANISVLWHADRLFALWEAGEAYALDASTLETRGRHAWSPEAQGLPFSAHPRVEPDGSLWNFGSAPWANALVLYRIRPDGTLAEVVPVPMAKPTYVHDFVVTERSLVFALPPLFFDGSGETFLDSHRWDPAAPMRWLVVDKSDLSKRRVLESPPGFIFHFANGWEAEGIIRLDACLYPDAEIMFGQQRDVMRGEWAPAPLPEATRFELDVGTGQVRRQALGLHSEFPSIDPRGVGRPHRDVYSLARVESGTDSHPLLNALVRQDTESGRTWAFPFPANELPEEHLFVPDPQGGAGWVVGTSLDVAERANKLYVFDADHVDEGPVALFRLPYATPLGLHGRFVPNG